MSVRSEMWDYMCEWSNISAEDVHRVSSWVKAGDCTEYNLLIVRFVEEFKSTEEKYCETFG